VPSTGTPVRAHILQRTIKQIRSGSGNRTVEPSDEPSRSPLWPLRKTARNLLDVSARQKHCGAHPTHCRARLGKGRFDLEHSAERLCFVPYVRAAQTINDVGTDVVGICLAAIPCMETNIQSIPIPTHAANRGPLTETSVLNANFCQPLNRDQEHTSAV
jgi:hypothetical protein